jgi:hypothetical protein
MTFSDNTRRQRERGALTIIELVPLFIAVLVTIGSAAILTKHYGDSGVIWIISAALGAGSWLLYARIILRLRR